MLHGIDNLAKGKLLTNDNLLLSLIYFALTLGSARAKNFSFVILPSPPFFYINKRFHKSLILIIIDPIRNMCYYVVVARVVRREICCKGETCT